MRQALENQWVKWGTGLIFGIIILAFVLFFGPQTQGMGPSGTQWVAKVAGRTIHDTELIAAVERYRRISSQRERLDDAAFAQLQRQLTLNMAAIELLAERARDAGLAISEDELRCFLVNWHRGYSIGGERICSRFPEDYAERFRNYDTTFWFTGADGSFTEYYDETVRNKFRMAARDYEAYKSRELLARYYLAGLADSVAVSPGEVRSVWERRNTTVSLEYIALDPSAAGAGEPTEEEVAAWASANELAISEAYAADTTRFAEPRQVHIRRIYVRKPAEDSPDFDDARDRYESTLARVTTGGEDFEAVAREVSEIQREADEGGDMGMRTESTISTDIWEATATMSAGDVTGVEQQYAWNIIRVEEVQDAQTRPLSDVRAEIAAELLAAERTEAAAAELGARGARVLELAATAETLAAAADAERAEREAAGTTGAPLPAMTTGAFAAERPSAMLGMEGLPPGLELPPEPADDVPGIGESAELMRIAFSLTADAPLHPELVEVDGVSHIVRLAERVEAPAEIPADAETAITAELRDGLADAIVGDENQLAALVIGMPEALAPAVSSLIDEALTNGDLVLRAGFFNAPDPVDEI